MIRTAWRFIIFDKAKSIGALAGTIMSVFLVGQQSGIFIYLTNAMCSLVINNDAYIWVVDDKTTNVNALAQLDVRLGYEIQSIKGVDNAYPIVVCPAAAKFNNGISSGITLVGVEVPVFAGGPWKLAIGHNEDIVKDGAIITDYFDKGTLGNVKPGEYFEVNGRKVFNAAETKGVRIFGGGVYTFTTIERARSLGGIGADKASAFLVHVKDNATEAAVIDRINHTIFGVRAWDAHDFAFSTVLTVLKTSGIAVSFGTLIFFALIVGFVIIGLTLYSSAIDRIRDYGTLKAIGADNRYIRRLIITQAMLISGTGFILGIGLTECFRLGIARTGVIFDYPTWLLAVLLAATILLALLGSLFAVRRITRLEPAAIFRG
jgi:putative ABC transport system permease protein